MKTAQGSQVKERGSEASPRETETDPVSLSRGEGKVGVDGLVEGLGAGHRRPFVAGSPLDVGGLRSDVRLRSNGVSLPALCARRSALVFRHPAIQSESVAPPAVLGHEIAKKPESRPADAPARAQSAGRPGD